MRKTRTTSVSRSHAGGLCEAGPDAVRDLPPPDRINMPSEVPGEGFLSSPMDFGDTRKSQEIKELQGALVQNMYHFATLFSEKPVLVALARPTQ